MFLSSKLVSLFEIAKDHVADLKVELATARAENAALRAELADVKITSSWLRAKVNDLEFQNKALLEKAYGVKLPVPVIQQATPALNPYKLPEAIFEHIDDETAKALGI